MSKPTKPVPFLELIYQDTTKLVILYDSIPSYTREAFKRDLVQAVYKRLKQSSNY